VSIILKETARLKTIAEHNSSADFPLHLALIPFSWDSAECCQVLVVFFCLSTSPLLARKRWTGL